MKLACLLWIVFVPMSLFAQRSSEATELAQGAAQIEKAVSQQPFLWKVKGKEVSGNVYLFGTLHLADKRVTSLHPVVKQALLSSYRVYTEVDLSGNHLDRARELYRRSDGRTLSQALGKKLSATINKELAHIEIDAKVKDFDQLKTWTFAVRLPQLVSKQENVGDVLDVKLWNLAEKHQKSIIPLESFEEQMKRVDKLPEAQQLGLVYKAVKELARKRVLKVNGQEKLIKTYLKGDAALLYKHLNRNRSSNKAQQNLTDAILYSRNKRMADKASIEITKYPKKNHFIAVGVAHLLGSNSIIQKLKKQGYTITRVQPQSVKN